MKISCNNSNCKHYDEEFCGTVADAVKLEFTKGVGAVCQSFEPVEKHLKLEVWQDGGPSNPRKEYDNMGTMACFHHRYDLGDETSLNSDNFNGWDELEEYLVGEMGAVVILPIYMLDHSGLTINTTGFNCSWDSGQIGFIYVTRDTIIKEYGNFSDESFEKARQCLLGEVETYDQYLTGDVWGYTVTDEDTGETVDSCGGYFGRKHLLEELKEQYPELMDQVED